MTKTSEPIPFRGNYVIVDIPDCVECGHDRDEHDTIPSVYGLARPCTFEGCACDEFDSGRDDR